MEAAVSTRVPVIDQIERLLARLPARRRILVLSLALDNARRAVHEQDESKPDMAAQESKGSAMVGV